MNEPALPVELPIVARDEESTLWRVRQRLHPVTFFDSRATHRFNAPGAEFGVCYFAESLEAALLETLIRGSAGRVIPKRELDVRHASSVRLRRRIRLLQFHSDGLVGLGCSADVPHRVPYAECQRWALAVWRHEAGLDGIEYRSRWNDRLFSVALFHRATDALDVRGTSIALNDLRHIRPILRHYDIGVS